MAPHLFKTPIPGCFTIEFDEHVDHRGSFAESYNAVEFQKAGLPSLWAQDNISISGPGVLRGLHLQRTKAQGKLIRCLNGIIFDVCVDLRPESESFMKWVGAWVYGRSGIYCPPGTAHGFYSPQQSTVYYKCTTLYDKSTDGGVNAFDPELHILWPCKEAIMSMKDKMLPTAKQWLKGET